ncbi:MAG: protein phosphatase 2C domain-containing protein [Pseudomonadota bacterium]
MHVDLIFEQGSGQINEDFHCRNENLFGVFDGATSLTSARYTNNLTGGFLAAALAGQTFRANNDSLINLAKKANRAIRRAMVENGVDLRDKGGLWCTSAAVVRLLKDSLEWVQIGDCLLMVIYDDGRHELLMDNFDHDLETLKLWKARSRNTNDGIFTALAEKIMETRANQNVTYGVLNGEEEALPFLKFGRESLRRVRHVLLFTDGLFVPKSELEERGDFSLLATLFLEGGLARIRDAIRAMERSDVDCRRYPRFKTHDDIAAFAITLNDAS